MIQLPLPMPPPTAVDLASPPAAARSVWARVDRSLALVLVLIACVAGTYAVGLKSPLRIGSDATVYLSIATAIADGRAIPSSAAFPRGYPTIVAALDVVGLGRPWAIVGLNLAFLASGLVVAYLLLRRVFALAPWLAALVCCLTLLSRAVVWTAPTPLSDDSFFGVALACIGLLVWSSRLRGARGWSALVAAGLLTAAAIEIRSIGVALVPPLVVTFVRRIDLVARVRAATRRRQLLLALGAAAALAVVCVGAVSGVTGTGYTAATKAGWHTNGTLSSIIGQIRAQLDSETKIVGELAVNVPRRHGGRSFESLDLVAGIVAVAACALGAWRRRRSLGILDLFVLSIALVLVAWPYNAVRLWIPALPFLIGYAAVALSPWLGRAPVKVLAGLCVAVFAAAAVPTIVQNIEITLAGSDFPARWGEKQREVRPTYVVAFAHVAHPGPLILDWEALRLLRRYEPRARLGEPRAAR
jgi:hypothetical protein